MLWNNCVQRNVQQLVPMTAFNLVLKLYGKKYLVLHHAQGEKIAGVHLQADREVVILLGEEPALVNMQRSFQPELLLCTPDAMEGPSWGGEVQGSRCKKPTTFP